MVCPCFRPWPFTTIMRLPGQIVLLLLLFQLFGVYIFLKGFLLTRQTFSLEGRTYDPWERFPIQQQRQQQEVDLLHQQVSLPLSNAPTVVRQLPFKKTILILIDALRFDFALNFTNSLNDYYLNRLPIISQLQDSQPQSSLLFQFRADPPTTTMQRIKGLMTGSLPTFIDAGANFASSAVGEDHLLRHIQAQYERIYFLGDDTWVHLFPESFQPNRTFDSDSFKMLDLDSVDNAIEKELWPLMEGALDNDVDARKEDWEIAIAHFLGVDHCGHTYGPSDPNMARKLNQMNGIIERLLKQVDQDTLLLVMGDHGMSVEGDHGGDSTEELMSTLFMYSKRPLTIQDTYYQALYRKIHDARATRLGYDFNNIAKRLKYDPKTHPIVAQIHLVPTLAYLLKTPIPFGNLGAIIPDLLVPSLDVLNGYSQTAKQLNILWHMIEEFRKNSLQVFDYLQNYQNQTHQLDFSAQKLAPITKHLHEAENLLAELLKQQSFVDALSDRNNGAHAQHQQFINQLEQVIMAYDAFLISTIKYCEAIWAQFDTGCMFLGILLLGLGTVTTLTVALQRQPQQQEQQRKSIIAAWKSLFTITFISFLITALSTYARYDIFHRYFLAHGWFEKMELIDWFGTGIFIALNASTLFVLYSKKPCELADDPNRRRDNHPIPSSVSSSWKSWDCWIILLGVTVQSFTLGSNSFVVWEDRGMLYVLNTLIIAWAIRNLSMLPNVNFHSLVRALAFPLLFMALIRVASVTGQCREEQFPYCDYVHSGILEFGYNTTGHITIGYVVVMYTLIIYFSSYIYHLLGLFYTGFYQISSLLVLLRNIYEIAQKSFTLNSSSTTTTDNAVYITVKIQKYMDVYLPRVVYGLVLVGSMVIVVQWFIGTRTMAQKKKYSWALYLYWTTVLAIIQRPLGALVVLCSPFLIQLLAVNPTTATATTPYRYTLIIRLTLLHYLGHFLFYVTGHQATLVSLPWKAAFVGFDDMNYYGGMLLVALSTMTGYVLCWLGWLVVTTHALSWQEEKNIEKEGNVQQILILLPALQTIPTLLCSLFIFILRRHLMTWKIFAPRFLLQILIEMGSYTAAILIGKLL